MKLCSKKIFLINHRNPLIPYTNQLLLIMIMMNFDIWGEILIERDTIEDLECFIKKCTKMSTGSKTNILVISLLRNYNKICFKNTNKINYTLLVKLLE